MKIKIIWLRRVVLSLFVSLVYPAMVLVFIGALVLDIFRDAWEGIKDNCQHFMGVMNELHEMLSAAWNKTGE